MKPAPFEYHAAGTIAEAVELLEQYGDDARVIAGGQSLVPMLSLRLAGFGHLVDVWSVEEMQGIARHDGMLRVGGSTVDADVERDPEVESAVPLLSRATPFIGHFQIRNRGTVGGSLAHADPAAEYPAVAVALDAELEVTSPAGPRVVPARDFFQGIWTTALEPGELLTAARFPVWEGRCGFAIEEFAKRHGDFAIAGAVAGVQLDADDIVTRCAVVLFGVGSTPVRTRSAEVALAGSTAGEHSAEDVAALAVRDVTEPSGDLHAPAEYRLRVARAMVARAWKRAVEEARDA